MVDYVLVSPLLLLVVLVVLQLAVVMHTRSVLTAAAEDAVRVAAEQGGDTGAGERRFTQVVGASLRSEVQPSLTWAWTLDTLTLRVRTRLPLVGPWAPVAMTVDASAWHEAWP